MNEFNREEPMEKEAKTDNGGHAEGEGEVTYSSSSGDEDFASETVSRENLFLIEGNTI